MTGFLKWAAISVGGVVAVVLLIAIGAYVYISVTYIDETITVGGGYGFEIGEPKQATYEKAKQVFDKQSVWIPHPIDERGYGPHRFIRFLDEEFELVRDRDEWDLYFSEGFLDSMTLKFEGGKLVSIHRHRQRIELP